MRKMLLAILVVLIGMAAASSAQTPPQKPAPKLTISANKVHTPEWLHLQGTGFTPKKNATSHLLRPDGTEYPVILILADDKGAFTHDIESLLLQIGTHTVWVEDDVTKTSSNRVPFEVIHGQN